MNNEIEKDKTLDLIEKLIEARYQNLTREELLKELAAAKLETARLSRKYLMLKTRLEMNTELNSSRTLH